MAENRHVTNRDEGGSEEQVKILRAFADATRLRLIRLLYREELNVQELATVLEVPQPSVSRHLAVLRSAELVDDRREGTKVFYRLEASSQALPAPLAAYLEEVGRSQHPDLERLETCLRSRTRDSRTFADRTAAQWDEIGRLLHSSSAALLAMANMAPPGLTVADLGTGTGLLLPFLARFADQVYAVDQSEEMLIRARQRCSQLGIGNVEFVQKSFEELKAELPLCDAILLHFVTHQVASPPLMLRQLTRFLKPGGRLVLVDRLKHEDLQAVTTFGSVWLGFEREQVGEWMREAGLEDFYWHALPTTAPDSDTEFGLFVAAGRAGR